MPGLHPFYNRQTAHFLAIFETGNIHAAAQKLGLTQPAMTMSLRQLEAQLETKLFERSVKGMAPTASAHVFYRYACSLRQSALYATEEIQSLAKGYSGTLIIGAGVAWASTIIPDALVDLANTYPDLKLDLVTGVADQLVHMFETGKVDILIAAGSVKAADDPGFETREMTNIQMIATAHKSHELANRRAVSIAELAATNWAGFYEDDSFLSHATHFLAEHGLPAPKISMRTNSMTALTKYVSRTNTVTIISSPMVEMARSDGLVPLHLAEPLWWIPVKIYMRAAASHHEPTQRFCRTVQESARVFEPA